MSLQKASALHTFIFHIFIFLSCAYDRLHDSYRIFTELYYLGALPSFSVNIPLIYRRSCNSLHSLIHGGFSLQFLRCNNAVQNRNRASIKKRCTSWCCGCHCGSLTALAVVWLLQQWLVAVRIRLFWFNCFNLFFYKYLEIWVFNICLYINKSLALSHYHWKFGLKFHLKRH